MTVPSELEAQIRKVLQHEYPGDSHKVESTVKRILELVEPFEREAREGLERYLSTFAELAK